MSEIIIQSPPIADRSAVEEFSECPRRARLRMQDPQPVGEAAVIGDAVHHCISETVKTYRERQGDMSAGDVADELDAYALMTRPDIQPDVLERIRAFRWPFAKYLNSLSAGAIIHFDGGEGAQSGQLAWDTGEVLLTSELDLMHLTASPEVLRIVDYKSGWKSWTWESVFRAFQFQLHSVLAFENYPDVQQVEIAVWQTMTGRLTSWVVFERRDNIAVRSRLSHAAHVWKQYHDAPVEKTPTWPTAEKCRICDVARRCPVASDAMRDIAADPGAFIDDMAAVLARAAEMEKLAEIYVNQHGPIESTGGVYGPDPKYKPRGASMKLTAHKGGV